MAKCLNSLQARFFTQFNLTITYRPNSRNVKLDVLSLQISSLDEASEYDETILPAACIIVALRWEIEGIIRNTHPGHTSP